MVLDNTSFSFFLFSQFSLLFSSLVPIEKNQGGFPELHHASYYGNLEQVKVLLQKTPDPTTVLDSSGHTALYWAIHEDRIAVVQYLLSQMKGKTIDPVILTPHLSHSSTTSSLGASNSGGGSSSSSNVSSVSSTASSTAVEYFESNVMLAARLGILNALSLSCLLTRVLFLFFFLFL